MVAKRTMSAPDWLDEKELLSLSLSHATTKHEYFASRTRIFAAKYGCDYATYKKHIESSSQESYEGWDDLIAWEAFDAAAEEWRSRYEELRKCLIS